MESERLNRQVSTRRCQLADSRGKLERRVIAVAEQILGLVKSATEPKINLKLVCDMRVRVFLFSFFLFSIMIPDISRVRHNEQMYFLGLKKNSKCLKFKISSCFNIILIGSLIYLLFTDLPFLGLIQAKIADSREKLSL